MRKKYAATLVLVALLASCTGSGGGPDPDVARSEPQRPPKEPRRVKIPKVASTLDPSELAKCLRDDRLDISSVAGTYNCPTDFIAAQVEENRSIDFAIPSDTQIVEKSEFEGLLEGANRKRDPRRAEIDLWLEWAFGYRKYGSDGSASSGRADNTELVAGFYIPQTGQVVIQKEGELDEEYFIMAHEFGHAAVDQSFGLKSPPARVIDDEALAFDALVEGDATLVELRVASRLTTKPKLLEKGLKKLLDGGSEKKRDALPHALGEHFIFPYQYGVNFVCSVWRKRGWEGVDKMYGDPPTTTGQIMFPERYLKGPKPKTPQALGKLKKPWERVARERIGAAHLKAIFEAPLDLETIALSRPLARAAGLDSGMYEVWSTRKDDNAVGVSLVERKEHPGLVCTSMLEWYEAAYSAATKEVIADNVVLYSDAVRATVISCQGRNVMIGMAPKRALAESLAKL